MVSLGTRLGIKGAGFGSSPGSASNSPRSSGLVFFSGSIFPICAMRSFQRQSSSSLD